MIIHECEANESNYVIYHEREGLNCGWVLSVEGWCDVAINVCPYCGVKLESPKSDDERYAESVGAMRREIADGLRAWTQRMENWIDECLSGYRDPPDEKIEVSRRKLEAWAEELDAAGRTNYIEHGDASWTVIKGVVGSMQGALDD